MSTLMSRDLNLTRPSSRVLATPGGASSICFGSEEPARNPAPVPQQQQQQQQVQQQQVLQQQQQQPRVIEQSNIPRTTSKDYGSPGTAVTGTRSSTKVAQAPGGNSSITFG